MSRHQVAIPATLLALASLACTGLIPAEQRLPGLCEAAVEQASLFEPHGQRTSPELVAACVDWYGTWAGPEELATLECMAEAQDDAQWCACRPEYQPPGSSWDGVPGLQIYPVRSKVSVATDQDIAREIAENAGVLGALREGSELDGVFGSSGLDSDIDGEISGFIDGKGIQVGGGGPGSEGSVGTALGDPIILGALDRSAIDAVIRRHMNQIRYCYEKGLTTNPSLGGKIVVKYVIAKDGTVSSAKIKSTTLNDNAVEMCVTGRFMRMQFPEPKGGGIVIVSYPFVFTPG